MLLVAGSVLALVSLGVQGMRALTHEETAARIKVVPSGVQRYDATLSFPDGRVETFALAGDDIYIDGHIVKWTPLANMLGLHTSYRLDRISGRYRALEQENTAPRTIHFDRHAGARRSRRARPAASARRLLRRRIRLRDLRAGRRARRARAEGLDDRTAAAAAADADRSSQELTARQAWIGRELVQRPPVRPVPPGP